MLILSSATSMVPEMQNGLISVIIPIWKPNLSHLKICIDSVLAQTYSDIEIVIIYKKSPEFDEGFYRLIKEYQDDKIKVVEDNRELPEARNAGIIKSRGEFIALMDADDFSEIDRFEKQLKFKEKHKCNVVGSLANLISNEGKKIAKIKVPITHQEIREIMMLRNPILNPSILMDKKMFEDIGLYNPSFVYGEDYELWFRAMFNGYKFGNVPECLISLRYNPQSVTRCSTWRKVRIYNIKAKNRAFLHYGFFKPRDVFYHLLSISLTYFIPPMIVLRVMIKFQKFFGWYKT